MSVNCTYTLTLVTDQEKGGVETYTYNDLKKGNYCAYTTRNFTKGMEVDKTFTYNSPCDDYFDNVNKILELYGKIQNLKK